MDDFSLCLNSLCLVGQSVMHIIFVSRLTGKKTRTWHLTAYFFLLCIIEFLFAKSAFNGILSICAGVLALYGISRLALGNRPPASWAAAILAFYISQLSFGIVNSVEAAAFPRLVGKPLLYPLLLFATLAAFVICACCYAAAQKLLSLEEDGQTPYIGLLLFPGMFFLAAELYILHTSYSVLPLAFSLEEIWKHSALLLLQILGLAALLCTLAAFRRVRCGFETQAALVSLTQAARVQKTYVAEAQVRYERTKSFRHDIKNHLSVLNGLLNSGDLEGSKAYLKKLETASASLSLPYQTGNPAVDILLGEKLELAKANGIAAEVSLLLPQSCKIDDFDLCVIFANALDNAVNACQSVGGARSIRVVGERQGDFYMLEFENTCPAGPAPPIGIGLSNIRTVAEKYHGAMLTEKNGRLFSLNVLLNIS